MSDANSLATFTYTDTGGAGTDTIVVSSPGVASASLTKTWAPQPKIRSQEGQEGERL
jgi:hypothetical protein